MPRLRACALKLLLTGASSLVLAIAISPQSRAQSLTEAWPAPPTLPRAAEEQPRSAMTPQLDRAKLFDAVVETIAKNFADEEKLQALDWSGRAAALRPKVLAATSQGEAVRLVKELVAGLATSHTALYGPDEIDYYILLDVVRPRSDPDKLMDRRFWSSRPHYPGIGAFIRELDGRHFVDGVMEGSPADRAGLKYGDEIVSVDGQPYSPIAAFKAKSGQNAELQVRRTANAAPVAMRVDVLDITPSEAFARATRASPRVIERNGKQIGYVHLWAVSDDAPMRAALATLRPDGGLRPDPIRNELYGRGHGEPSRDAPKPPLDFLIVDARGRVGGNGAAAQGILNAVAEPAGNLIGSLSFEEGNNARERRHGRGESARSDRTAKSARYEPGFAGRAVLLTDAHTRSAGELLAAGFRNSKLGTIIGTPTAGAVMGGATFLMPGDLVLYVAMSKVKIDGEALESRGVTPDVRVERPLPYANGADPVLEAALALLAGESK